MDVLSDGVVDVEEGGITWSGPASEAPDSGGAEEIRVPGLLMPALINGHCHTPMVLFRGAGEGLPVDRWLSEVMWPRESRLTPADVQAGMALGVAEMLTNGIGTSSEMYFHADAMAAAVEEANFRSVISAAFIEDDSFAGLGSVAEQMDSAISFNTRCAGRPTVSAGLGPHSAYALGEDTLASIGRLAAEHDMLVHIHAAELPAENEMVGSMGSTVIQVLDSLGLLTSRTVVAHGIWVDDDDMAIMTERGVGVCHCPVSNMVHAMGVAPLEKLQAHGIDVCLATDGPASHYRLDLFEEMRSALRMHRLSSGDAGVLAPVDVLRMTTETAASVLGLDDLGQLRPGFRADMVHMDLDQLSFGPILSNEDVVPAVVWGGSRAAVRDVWIEGSPSVVNGVPIGAPVHELRAEVQSRAARLANP
jgi:5-methylthioadenosine/S-adenosylhomocysteine deaminase